MNIHFTQIFKTILDYFFGKKIVVLGPSKAGKTTFLKFIETGEISERPPQTTAVDWRRLPFEIDKPEGWRVIIDSVGADGAQQTWRLCVEEADFLLYFIDASRLLERGDEIYSRRINRDCDLLFQWLKGRSIRSSVIITHLDKCGDNEIGYLEGHEDLLRLRAALGGTEKVRCVKGSLLNVERAAVLVREIAKA